MQSSKKSRQQEQGKLKRSVVVETSTSITLESCDGLGGYDWSDQTEEGPNYELMAFASSREIAIRELRKKLEIAQKGKDGIQLNKGLGYENYNSVPPPYTGNSPNLSFTGLDKFVNKPVVENYKAKSSEEEPKVVEKNDDAPITKEWVSDNEEDDVSQSKIEKKIGNPQMDLQDQGVIDSGCLRYMTGNMSYLTDYEEIDGGYVAFGGNPKGGKITGNVPIKLLTDESQVLLVAPRKNNMYSVDLKNIVPKGGLHRFFLATKDETSGILKSFIIRIENLVDHNVKVIRYDNGTEFKNREMNQFCEMKGILRQFSVARTPQQNEVAKRRSRTLIEAARIMLADSKLPTTFWTEAVNTACYVQNRVLVVKPHNKTPYELFHGKFDGRADEGFFVGYSLNSKAFRVFNSRTRIVEENLHIRFSESTPNVVGTQSNSFAGTKASDNACQARKEIKPVKDYILLPLWTVDPPFSQDPKSSHDDVSKPSCDDGKKVDEDPRNLTVTVAGTNEDNELPFDPNMPSLEDVSIFNFSSDDEDDGTVADMNNLDTTIQEEPKKVIHALKDPSWIEAMQEELLQFKKIKKEVYVCQPPRFKDPNFPDRVYKVEKTLYGLHQAPKAWYETLSTYLLDNGFQRGKINKTLFIKRNKGDILLVQVYVDDIIFGLTKKELCFEFERLMHEKFQMSSLGELTFFSGLQVKQKKDGIFISQDKHVAESLKKFGFIEVKTASTNGNLNAYAQG
nr:ribonuclease H-like domain-containing protein [Tanacetum cinerariifolium]